VHKFFAKTLFLGKKVIFLPECHSTNDHLTELSKREKLIEGTVLWTDFQTSGKGQRGNRWESAVGENLLASMFLKPRWLDLDRQYLLTIATGLAIRNAIQQYTHKKVKVKWPNDVYVGQSKISGILTECSIQGKGLESAVVGFGINVNQQEYQNSQVISLVQLTGKIQDRELLLEEILLQMEQQLLRLKSGGYKDILSDYYRYLIGYNEIRTFRSPDEFQGMIIGVDRKGSLRILITNAGNTRFAQGSEVSFGLKEITQIL
jgi:BirA family biotin operon repressor/biotin-[acetyl-CoA-carboxylase] ligase